MITIEDIKNRLDIESEKEDSFGVYEIINSSYDHHDEANEKRQEIVDYLEENGIESEEDADCNSLVLFFELEDQKYEIYFEYEYRLTINGIELYINYEDPDEYDFTESVKKIYNESYSYDEFIDNYTDFVNALDSKEILEYSAYVRIDDLINAVNGVKYQLQKENTLDDNSIEEIVDEIFSKFIV